MRSATLSFPITAERVEFWLLCCLLFVLPTLEAPKNVALVLYVVVWASRRASLAALRAYRPAAVEVALLAIIAACGASTLANWPFDNGVKGLSDTVRYAALFVCVFRAGYSEAQHRTLATVITWGTLFGLVVGMVELMEGRRPNLELHSAGPATLAAMYVSTASLLAFGLFLTRWLPARTATASPNYIPIAGAATNSKSKA